MAPPALPRPSLTERRKAATELAIARAAARLFAARGPGGTSAEEIAHAAGVALRTFYRYFRNKQDAVAPLLARGPERWRTHLAAAEPGPSVAELLERSVVKALSEPDDCTAEGLRWTRGLLRAAAGDPALRAVWYRVNRQSEERLVPLLSELAGPDAEALQVRLAAAAATDAVRVALETWAGTDAPVGDPDSPAELALRCLREVTCGVGVFTGHRISG
ncbi:TetR/AcrR family transcriptional regulator [Streptomyces sp. NPDC059176]|uniref:TetR/AcrR family transcriptional regulator n=1 Tax=unclassified Streptomyces TaxID=2593676 RepID=UPI0036BE1707